MFFRTHLLNTGRKWINFLKCTWFENKISVAITQHVLWAAGQNQSHNFRVLIVCLWPLLIFRIRHCCLFAKTWMKFTPWSQVDKWWIHLVVFQPRLMRFGPKVGMKFLLCPSMGPKWFWTVQIILVKYQSFWTGPIYFGSFQIILDRFKL